VLKLINPRELQQKQAFTRSSLSTVEIMRAPVHDGGASGAAPRMQGLSAAACSPPTAATDHSSALAYCSATSRACHSRMARPSSHTSPLMCHGRVDREDRREHDAGKFVDGVTESLTTGLETSPPYSASRNATRSLFCCSVKPRLKRWL
jgi:hypothetical protein